MYLMMFTAEKKAIFISVIPSSRGLLTKVWIYWLNEHWFSFFFAELPLYDSSKDFVCLDGSLTIPFSSINDDYCDCKDGSDEPGKL